MKKLMFHLVIITTGFVAFLWMARLVEAAEKKATAPASSALPLSTTQKVPTSISQQTLPADAHTTKNSQQPASHQEVKSAPSTVLPQNQHIVPPIATDNQTSPAVTPSQNDSGATGKQPATPGSPSIPTLPATPPSGKTNNFQLPPPATSQGKQEQQNQQEPLPQVSSPIPHIPGGKQSPDNRETTGKNSEMVQPPANLHEAMPAGLVEQGKSPGLPQQMREKFGKPSHLLGMPHVSPGTAAPSQAKPSDTAAREQNTFGGGGDKEMPEAVRPTGRLGVVADKEMIDLTNRARDAFASLDETQQQELLDLLQQNVPGGLADDLSSVLQGDRSAEETLNEILGRSSSGSHSLGDIPALGGDSRLMADGGTELSERDKSTEALEILAGEKAPSATQSVLERIVGFITAAAEGYSAGDGARDALQRLREQEDARNALDRSRNGEQETSGTDDRDATALSAPGGSSNNQGDEGTGVTRSSGTDSQSTNTSSDQNNDNQSSSGGDTGQQSAGTTGQTDDQSNGSDDQSGSGSDENQSTTQDDEGSDTQSTEDQQSGSQSSDDQQASTPQDNEQSESSQNDQSTDTQTDDENAGLPNPESQNRHMTEEEAQEAWEKLQQTHGGRNSVERPEDGSLQVRGILPNREQLGQVMQGAVQDEILTTGDEAPSSNNGPPVTNGRDQLERPAGEEDSSETFPHDDRLGRDNPDPNSGGDSQTTGTPDP